MDKAGFGEEEGFAENDISLGDIMRGERATLGKSLLDVQRELRISAEYLEAIENADATKFKAAAFISGYVKSYARYLGLDPEDTLSKFCAESGFSLQSTKQGKDTFARRVAHKAAPISQPRVTTQINRDFKISTPLAQTVQTEGFFARIDAAALGSVAVLAGLIALIGYGAVAIFKEVQQVNIVPFEETPIVLADFDTGDMMSTSQTNMEPPQDEATANLDRFYAPQALTVPVVVARDAPISSLNPTEVGAYTAPIIGPEGEGTLVTASLSDTDGVTEGGAAKQLPQVVEEAPNTVSLMALEPAWVRVKSSEGTVLFEKIMSAGETYDVPSLETPPSLRAGMSGFLYFKIGGKAYGPLGSGTSAVKEIEMGIDFVKEKFPEVDLDQNSEAIERLANLMVSSPQTE